MYLACLSIGNLKFNTLYSPFTSWRFRCHSVLNVGHSWILLMGPVSFATTMDYSVAMVNFNIYEW